MAGKLGNAYFRRRPKRSVEQCQRDQLKHILRTISKPTKAELRAMLATAAANTAKQGR